MATPTAAPKILTDITPLSLHLAPDEDGVLRCWTLIRDNTDGREYLIPGGDVEIVEAPYG